MELGEGESWRIEDVRAILRAHPLDAGLVVQRIWEERHEGCRILFAEYHDSRIDTDPLGFWWDVDAEPGLMFTDSMDVATYLRIWLEEAFHAGPAIIDRPRDRDGLSWVCPAVAAAALPPVRQPL